MVSRNKRSSGVDSQPESVSGEKLPRASRLLAWFCPPDLYETIAGDLEEQYETDQSKMSERRARLRYTWGVLRFFRPGILFRNRQKWQFNAPFMFRNYLKVASRNLYKQKFFTAINALGLSIGIALCALIFLYIQDERSFDRFHTQGDRIYRLHVTQYDHYRATQGLNPESKFAYLQAPWSQTLRAEVPEVERVSVFISNGNTLFKHENEMHHFELYYVENDFLQMFDFGMIKGDSTTALSDPSSIVITQKLADAFFGNEDPIGKILTIDSDGAETAFTVSALVRDVPANSSLEFAALVSSEKETYYQDNLSKMRWNNYSYPTFVQLRENATEATFQASLDGIYDRYVASHKELERKNLGIPDSVQMGRYEFTAIPDMHHRTDIAWDKVTDPQYMWILGGLALLVLTIACVNYITLAISTSIGRAKEVGVRKTMGAMRSSLIGQFSTESMLVALLAWVVALGFVVLFLPIFNQFTEKAITLSGSVPVLIAITLLIALLSGVLAGSYPAFYVSRLDPIEAFKGNKSSKVKVFFTRYLVVFQFALSAFLLISTVVMYSQMKYIAEKNLGFDAEMVISVSLQQGYTREASAVVERLRQEFTGNPDIESISAVNMAISRGLNRTSFRINEEQYYPYLYRVDDQYLNTMKIELLHGRNFKQGLYADTAGTPVIVNEAFMRAIGWEDFNQPFERTLPFEVVGVIRDHHFRSLNTEIEPMYLQPVGAAPQRLLVRLKPGTLPRSLDEIGAIWKRVVPDKPFVYTFIDEDIASQYASYQNWMKLMGISASFAILIACLGLFGLAGINAVNRTKEMGIRKVMGATARDIVILMNRPFVWMSLIAFLIAIPASWYVMNDWLSKFKYAIALDWTLFAASFLITLGLALLTVSYHALRAAGTNPADTLKYE